MGNGIGVLAQLWEESADRLATRCTDMTDAEFFWEPAPDCWTVWREADGSWTYHYAWPAPEPAPVTTIAWRLVHIAADNWIYWEWAFGPGVRTFPDLPVPSTAADALRTWRDSRGAITQWLRSATEDALAEPRPCHLGEPKSAGDVIAILLDEQIHHGAEIALLRDLFLRHSSTPRPEAAGAS
jgi:DinB superfamily